MHSLVFALFNAESSCGPEGQKRVVCDAVYRATGNSALAHFSDVAVSRGSRILLIVVITLVMGRLLRRMIRRLTNSLASGANVERVGRVRRRMRSAAPKMLTDAVSINQPAQARRGQRAEALGTLLNSAANVIIWTFAVISILNELGLDVAPLIAGAGIAGVAIGFGAQNLVKDLLTGVFMLLEDQYGVGDVVDVGSASGKVEAVGLRSTKIRDDNGTLWHVPNGQIGKVGNKSQQWARAVVDVEVAWEADPVAVRALLERVAADIVAEAPEEAIDAPEVLGIEQFTATGMRFRVQVKTQPARQWALNRRLRIAIKQALDAAEIPTPHVNTVLVS